MGTAIGNVAIYVANLERSERFYVDTLGLAVRARIEADAVSEVIVGAADGGGSALMLACSKPPGEPPIPSGIWKVFVETDVVHGSFAAALAAGATPVLQPMRLKKFRVTIAMVTDPDGYTVELAEIEPR
jgi:catechol 2,3-dioxygenase-like lactoylglutathione lyase family enzyme